VTTFDDIAGLMRAQAAHRRLRNDPIDDDTVLRLLDVAIHATNGERPYCSFVVVRDPDVRHQLARAYRQGWSIYKRVLRSRARSADALLAERQWESDHFEDVPVLVVATLPGPRPRFRATGAASFYGTAFTAVQNLRLAAAAEGLGASATTLPLWSAWEARRTLGLPRRITPISVVALGRPQGTASGPADGATRSPSGAPVPPIGNVVHLDRWGHQPFRARRRL